MKRVLVPLVVALLLFVAGAIVWTLGSAEERVARARTQLATLEYETLAAENGGNLEGTAADGDADDGRRALDYATRLPAFGAAMAEDVTTGRATASYWMGRYGELALERDAGGALIERDPRLLLLAANAAFRASRLDQADRDTALDLLETLIRNYADVLRSGPESDALVDAAYNYELTVRARSALERAKGATLPPKPANRRPPTIHGQAGGPPKDADPNQFRVVVPKRSDERSNDPEGGQGGGRTRKG